MNFTEDFKNILNGFQALQVHLEAELTVLNEQINCLESRQNNDDEFYKGLELLLQKRNK